MGLRAGRDEDKMKHISIDNGHSYTTVKEAITAVGMNVIAQMMDDEVREKVHATFSGTTDEEFVVEYLRISERDLIIG